MGPSSRSEEHGGKEEDAREMRPRQACHRYRPRAEMRRKLELRVLRQDDGCGGYDPVKL